MIRTYIPVIIASLLLFSAVIWSYASAKNRTSTIVLPGGLTYLGPSPSPISPSTPSTPTWSTWKGAIYPYSFDYPATMNLGLFPNDPMDSVTAFIDGTDASQNVFFRVEKLQGAPMDYATNWWKQYNWKGVSSVTTFTNENGLKGYRAQYLNEKNETPYDHIFFEVPNRKDLIIWISGRLFSKQDFDRLVESVTFSSR